MFENYSLSSFVPTIVVLAVAVIYYFYKKSNSSDGAGKTGTAFLDSFSVDFTQLAQLNRLDPVVGREEEVLRLAQILSRRTKNNAILVGPPGVGKTAIVEGLAQRIIQKEVSRELIGKRVLSLNVANLLSGTKYRGEFEKRAKQIVQEITNSNRTIILFIDEVHTLVQSQGTEGAVNFADILKPALARGDLQMIGATTTVEYEKYIKPDSSLERRFQPVEVREPTEEETVIILQGVKGKYRDYHKVEFTDAALEVAAGLSKKLINDRKLPDKAIDALDEAGAMVKVSHIHTDVPIILYQAAIEKHPEVADLWKRIQDLDEQIRKNNSNELIKTRELLEKELEGKGVVTVDSADIEKVINFWKK